MKTLYVPFILILGLLISSCSSDLSESVDYGSIAGSVSDATTGEPVATVNVTLVPGGASTVTGSDGSFLFKNIDAGEYTIEISKENYKSNSRTVTVKAGDPTSVHLLIERIPSIVTADRETLDFGDNPSLNTLSFNIVNSSYEDLNWEIEERCDWITEVKPAKGVLAYGKTEGIVVVIDREKLSNGENKSVIVIRSSDGSSEVNVVAYGPSIASVRMDEVTNITTTSATFLATIVRNGNPVYSECGFVFSQNSMPTLENCISNFKCSANYEGQFQYGISGLQIDQTYYVRAYAINDMGIAYSANEIRFNTEKPTPKVVTLDVTNIKPNYATFQGEITFAGEPVYTECGFVYDTTPEPTTDNNKIIVNRSGVTGYYSTTVDYLPTTYYVRAYATNKYGTVYGESKSVNTEWVDFPEAGIAVQADDLASSVNFYTAQTVCKNSRIGGYSDWRLPTIDELAFIYLNRDYLNKNNNNNHYWSSNTSNNDTRADYLKFSTGEIYSSDVLDKHSVIAVRTLTKD